MRWNIAFEIPYTDEPMLTHFPEMTVKYRAATMSGASNNVTVAYIFKYAPQSWRQMQQIGRIKILMKRILPSIRFDENIGNEIYNSEADLGSLYFISELGQYFKTYVQFPQPLYPVMKEEMMSRLAMYAKKLYYQDIFYLELVLAMAIHFNEKLGSPYNRKQLQSKTLSIMSLDRDEWRRKLDSESLMHVHKSGGKKRGVQVSVEADERRNKIKELLPLYKKSNGKFDIKSLVEITGFSRSNVYSILKKIDTESM